MQNWDSWIEDNTKKFGAAMGSNMDLMRRQQKMLGDPAYTQSGINRKAEMERNVFEGYAPIPVKNQAGRRVRTY